MVLVQSSSQSTRGLILFNVLQWLDCKFNFTILLSFWSSLLSFSFPQYTCWTMWRIVSCPSFLFCQYAYRESTALELRGRDHWRTFKANVIVAFSYGINNIIFIVLLKNFSRLIFMTPLRCSIHRGSKDLRLEARSRGGAVPPMSLVCIPKRIYLCWK